MNSLKENYFDLLYSKDGFSKHLGELTLIKLNLLKNKLYRYRPINEYLLDTLINDTAFLCPANNFNDPYDSGLTVNYSELQGSFIKSVVINDFVKAANLPEKDVDYYKNEFLKMTKDIDLKYMGYVLGKTINLGDDDIDIISQRIQQLEDDNNDIYENYTSGLNSIYQKNVNVTCFSENNNNILMWSHYAQNHKGICIEYNFSNIDYKSIFLLNLSPVFYTDKLFDINDYDHLNLIDKIRLATLSKFNCWEYEKEWRFISFDKNEQLYKLPKPSSIILGTKISEWDKLWITDLCNKRGIPVKHALMDRTQYKLHIK